MMTNCDVGSLIKIKGNTLHDSHAQWVALKGHKYIVVDKFTKNGEELYKVISTTSNDKLAHYKSVVSVPISGKQVGFSYNKPSGYAILNIQGIINPSQVLEVVGSVNPDEMEVILDKLKTVTRIYDFIESYR